MFLLALSFGTGFFFFTAIEPPFQMKCEENILNIPQKNREDNADNLCVLLWFHASDYFVYRGLPIGFQYEMFKELEKDLGRNIDIKVETDVKIIQKELFEGDFDIIAMDFNYSAFLLPLFETSIPHSYSYPVLVSGKQTDTIQTNPIVISHDFSSMLFFDEESPFSKYPVQTSLFSTEELFEKVDSGEISYLLCDYNQVITLLPFYSNVQILEKAGPRFERRWVLNKKNIQLNEEINQWLLEFKKTEKYNKLLKKYFSQESSLINASFAHKQSKDISQYDAVIRKYAKKYEMDWRFVASIIFQETKFISGLSGKGGSYGLMQLMPVTMDYYGITEEDDDEAHIRVGIQHLNMLRNSFEEVEDQVEKLYFVAAAFNAGRGHIFDAQRLCAKYEGDFLKWNEVAKYLKLKSHRQFAKDPVVKSGYFPGTYTVKYVQQVMERYSAYKAAYP